MFPLRPGQIKRPTNRAKNNELHTQPLKTGMGFNYGTGMKNPVGRIRDSYVVPVPDSNKKLGEPPKSLA